MNPNPDLALIPTLAKLHVQHILQIAQTRKLWATMEDEDEDEEEFEVEKILRMHRSDVSY